ncbi:hypothetical protein JCM18899A_08290 [Nocardioides sp. AN3]
MDATLEFIGTATTLLRLGSHTLLTDPDFRPRGKRAYLGNGLFSKRRTEPARQPDNLPALDGIVLSHLHGDHFDPVARERLGHDLPVLTTPAASRKLGRWGFHASQGMRTWQTTHVADGLSVTSVPGEHAPSYARALLPPVMGSVVEARDENGAPFRVYVTGDTLLRPCLRDIIDRVGPVSGRSREVTPYPSCRREVHRRRPSGTGSAPPDDHPVTIRPPENHPPTSRRAEPWRPPSSD